MYAQICAGSECAKRIARHCCQRGDGAAPAAHNHFVVQKPEFVEQVVVEAEDPNSLLVVDNRDERLISPFQNWLVDEIMSNAAGSINVLTERDQLMPPNSGYPCCVFANYTLKGGLGVHHVVEDSGGPMCSAGFLAMQAVPSPTRLARRLRGHVRHLGHLLLGPQLFCDEVLNRTANDYWIRPHGSVVTRDHARSK